MRLVTIDSREQGGRPGVWLSRGEILDIAAAPGSLRATQKLPASVVSILAEGQEGLVRLEQLIAEIEAASDSQRGRWREAGVLLPARSTRLLAPVRRPGLLLIAGADGRDAQIKNPHSVTGPGGRPARLPGGADCLPCRCMAGIVLGRSLYSATAAQVRNAIGACTLLVEFALPLPAAAALQGASAFVGGQYPGACALGPALLTVDEAGSLRDLQLTIRVNDHQVGKRPAFAAGTDPVELIARLSRDYAFRPGDIIAVAQPVEGADRPLMLQAGDQLSLSLNQTLELAVDLAAQS